MSRARWCEAEEAGQQAATSAGVSHPYGTLNAYKQAAAYFCYGFGRSKGKLRERVQGCCRDEGC